MAFLRSVFNFVLFAAIIAALFYYALPKVNPVLRHPLVLYHLMTSDPPDRLPLPVQGVKIKNLRDSWGEARSSGRSHQGIDIFAPCGREVISSTTGIVTSVGVNQLGGNVVWILGPGGAAHYYAHLQSYSSIQAGDVVEPGTVLGFVGNTGNAKGTPCHLHYGIYNRGHGAVNPFPLLKDGES